jgi:type II secretory pathway pseudopilin PulG
LVVMAIIALLISILLPSLSKARAQARTSLCLSRISQLTKALLLYGEDYDETLPFIGVGYQNVRENDVYPFLGPAGRNTEHYLARFESWVIPGEYFVDDGLWLNWDWGSLPGGGPTVQEGTLFGYARFEALYRCPEFERIADASKTQNVFNYTRSILGRKAYSALPPLEDEEANGEPVSPGHVMKPSAVHSPALMMMLLDEQWDFHCAGNYEEGGTVSIGGMWMAAEPIHTLVGDMLGSYHPPDGKVIDWPEIRSSKQGSVSFYDGHAALLRDPWPWREAEGNNVVRLLGRIAAEPEVGMRTLGLLFEGIFAQRGVAYGLEDAINLILAFF